MGLLRAMSTTKARRGGGTFEYEKLFDESNEPSVELSSEKEPVLKRAFSVPARALFRSSSRKINSNSSSSASASASSSSSRFNRLFRSSSRRSKPPIPSSSSSSSSSSSASSTASSSRFGGNSGYECGNSKQQAEKKTGGKVHPVFGLFDGRSWSKRKFTANPDFSRYIDYLKEGGEVNNKINNNNNATSVDI